MGWFWTEQAPKPFPAVAPHPVSGRSDAPPPECPMHASTQTPAKSSPPATCPVKHTDNSSQSSISASSPFSKLNPLNYMPSFSNTRAPGQRIALPTEREPSTIPRGDTDANWEYPSPQQMYHALLRKGGIDEEQAAAVESMVAIHNFLNEGAWDEIRGWEKRFAGGLGSAWDECIKGEERWAQEHELSGGKLEPAVEPKLIRFMGRPKDRSPKAAAVQWLGWAFPSQFGSEPPFDRHDWFVQRRLPDGNTKEVRYVIDYYSAPPEPTGEPVFYLDVRPAIDTPTAAVERMMRYGGDVWHRASGASARS